jgi:hypothetical protein
LLHLNAYRPNHSFAVIIGSEWIVGESDEGWRPYFSLADPLVGRVDP